MGKQYTPVTIRAARIAAFATVLAAVIVATARLLERPELPPSASIAHTSESPLPEAEGSAAYRESSAAQYQVHEHAPSAIELVIPAGSKVAITVVGNEPGSDELKARIEALITKTSTLQIVEVPELRGLAAEGSSTGITSDTAKLVPYIIIVDGLRGRMEVLDMRTGLFVWQGSIFRMLPRLSLGA